MARDFTGTHWRDASRTPRFYIMDATAAFPLLLFLLHMSWWTLSLALVATIFFAILERFKFTPRVFLRWLRATLAGSLRVAHPWWRE